MNPVETIYAQFQAADRPDRCDPHRRAVVGWLFRKLHLNTRGVVELIILNVGLDLGVLSPALFSSMVLMALVTTFMTSPLLSRIYPESLS